MTQTSKPIVFFGSGPVAAQSLRLLAKSFTIEAVITKPRPKHHRGTVPVMEAADSLHLPIFTAANKQELDNIFINKPVKADLAILVDFGIIVSQPVIDYFPLGIINSHFSILPEWRGADPISFAILSGQETTGVSLMLLTAGMDEGPLIAYRELPLTKESTTPHLTQQLIGLSHTLLTHYIPHYLNDASIRKGFPQSITGRQLSYSRKLTKSDATLDWTKPAEQLEREIRAFIEWPKSKATIGGLEVIITKGHSLEAHGIPGTTQIINNLPVIYCGHNALAIDKLKPVGKKEMTGQEFLAGYKTVFLHGTTAR